MVTSPHFCRTLEGIFLPTHEGARTSYFHGWGSWNSQNCPPWAWSNASMTTEVSYRSSGSLRGFCSGKFWFSAFACLSLQFWRHPFSLAFPMDLKGVVDFKVCSASYMLLGGRGNFYMPDQTLEVALVKSEVFVLYTSVNIHQTTENWCW